MFYRNTVYSFRTMLVFFFLSTEEYGAYKERPTAIFDIYSEILISGAKDHAKRKMCKRKVSNFPNIQKRQISVWDTEQDNEPNSYDEGTKRIWLNAKLAHRLRKCEN